MVNSRAPWSVALLAVASGCTVANPLFILPDDGSGGGSTAAVTDTAPGTDTFASTEPAMTTSAGPGTGSATTSPAMICGDGVMDPGEDCDDGNDISGDDCESNCKPLFRKDPALIPGTTGATAMAVGDVDADGKLDVLLAYADCPGPCVRRYINKGAAIFEFDDNAVGTPVLATHLVSAQLGGEPGADFAFAADGFAYVYSESGMPISVPQFGGDPESLIAAEIEGGAPADLLIVDDLNGHINYTIATNVGFGTAVSISEVSAPRRAAVADVDADGATDFLFTAEGGNGVGLWLDLKHDGAPTGPFATEATTASALATGAFALEPGHSPNAVFFGQVQTGGSLQVYVNKGAGQYEKFKNNVAAKNDVMALLSPRLNSPTDDSIIAVSPLSFQVFTLVAGEFKNGFTWTRNEDLLDVAAGELNGDGRTDLVVLTKNNCYILLNQAP